MSRLSQRMSAMWSTIRCPRCRALVPVERPIEPLGPSDAPAPPGQEEGKRWSVLWTAPRGDFCPERDFPLSKYFGRIKWIRTLMVGVGIVLVAIVFQIVGVVGLFGHAYIRTVQIVVALGAAVALVGAVGVVVGGKHGRISAAGKA